MTKLQSGERERLLRLGKKTWSVLFRIFRVYLILALSFVVLYPIFYLISMSFRPVEEFTNPSIIWVPETWTLDILKKAWEAVDFPVSLRNTVIFALSNTVFSILPCCLAGYGFARFQFKGKRLLFVCLIISIIVPAQTIIVPLYVRMRYFDFFFLGQLGRLFTGAPFTVKLLDSYGAMWFLSLLGNGLRGGMFIFIFRQFFTSMPQDLEDAAYVDGAGFFPLSCGLSSPALRRRSWWCLSFPSSGIGTIRSCLQLLDSRARRWPSPQNLDAKRGVRDQ